MTSLSEMKLRQGMNCPRKWIKGSSDRGCCGDHDHCPPIYRDRYGALYGLCSLYIHPASARPDSRWSHQLVFPASLAGECRDQAVLVQRLLQAAFQDRECRRESFSTFAEVLMTESIQRLPASSRNFLVEL